MRRVHVNPEMPIPLDARIVFDLPKRRPARNYRPKSQTQGAQFNAEFVADLNDILVRSLADSAAWRSMPKHWRGQQLHLGIALHDSRPPAPLLANVLQSLREQIPAFLAAGAVRRSLPFAHSDGFGWYLRICDSREAAPEMFLQVIAERELAEGAETVVTSDSTLGPAHKGAHSDWIAGCVQFVAQTHEQQNDMRGRLAARRQAVQNELGDFLARFDQGFAADEDGFRIAYQVLEAIQLRADYCGCRLQRLGATAFLRRLPPPHQSQQGCVLFAVHSFSDGEPIDQPSDRIPPLELVPCEPSLMSEGEGGFELQRQAAIERFRRKLVDQQGHTIQDREAIKQEKIRINRTKSNLNVSFGFLHEGQLLRVSLDTSYASFQLRRTVRGLSPPYSGTEFPPLCLIDNRYDRLP